ncbi:hypothetical protein ACFLQZ_02025 [Acidobacteriota bacterium]
MEKFRPLIWVFLFGSLWGISEVVGGEALYAANIPLASVWLSTWALFLLAFARAQNNTPGTSSAIAGIATLFRLVNAGPFICHLLGIFLLGVAFDLAATFLLKRKKKIFLHGSLTGILGAYGGYALFALIITYVVQYKTWVAGGWPKVAEHIFLSGSLTALISAVLVPLGYWLSQKETASKAFHSRWATNSALALIFFLWIVGRLTGF